MSHRLLLWLNEPDRSWLDPSDTPLAMAALIVQIAERDLPPEGVPPEAVDAVLARRFDLTRSEARELRQACHPVLARARDPGRMAGLLRRYVPEPERSAMAEAVFAAWGRDGREARIASVVGERLGVRVPQTPISGP